MVLNLIYGPAYVEEDRDVNAIYNLIINLFQGIVANWFNGLSPGIRNLIELDVKRNLVISIELGVWSIVKYHIGQCKGYEYLENQDNAQIKRRKEAPYKITNLRICNLSNFKSFFCEFDKYYYDLYDSTENQETYIQLLLNKFPNPWNKHFAKKI